MASPATAKRPRPSAQVKMSDPEVYLPDQRVIPIQERMAVKWPLFVDWGTDFLTVRHEASTVDPYNGPLPDGSNGMTIHPIIEFLLISDYPATRPIQRKQGVRHGTRAIVYEAAWLEAEKDFTNSHFVRTGEAARDPLEIIFEGMAFKHTDEMMSLASIMN